jgi:hypothetical protein
MTPKDTTAGALATASIALSLLCGCANENPGLIGHTATVTGLAACAGTTDAADTMERNGMSSALGFSSAGEALQKNAHAFRSSGGIFLQKGWKIRFVDHEDYAGNDFTKVKVESVPKFQDRYRGAACWLSTPGVQTLVDRHELRLNF